ncbi:arylesterase [Hellea sp.]|nr:arylesterase [Hellea sp.]
MLSAFGLIGCGQAPDTPVSIAGTAQQDTTQTPPARVEAQAPVVVFLGDSLTAGYNLSPQDALPEQVGLRLNAAGLPVTVINAGVSGDTSANGLARYDWSVKSANPDFLILALGANDYLQNVPPETTRSNLMEILNKAKADNIPVILVGLKPRSKAQTGSRDAKFGAIYPELANQFNVPLYPALLEGVRTNPDLLQSDGLHPTAKGVEVMADRLATFLNPLIR